ADVRAVAEETVERKLTDAADLDARAAALSARAAEPLKAQGAGAIEIVVTANLKYDGADSALPIPYAGTDLAQAFVSEHRKRFGFVDPARAIVVASLSAEAVAPNQYAPPPSPRR